jgi:hypothetical protein
MQTNPNPVLNTDHKNRFFGKLSNPEPVPEPESDFLNTQYLNPNPNPSLKVLKNFVLIFAEILNF